MIVESYGDVIILSGSLKSNQWETLHTAISLTLKRHEEGVIIDCSGLKEMTPLGADTFRSVMDFIHEQHARVIVASVPTDLMDVIRAAPDVKSQLPIAATVEEARASLDLLRSGDHNDHDADHKRKSDSGDDAAHQIIVCLNGSNSDEYLLTSAREIANGIDARVRLIYPILVPRELPINAPLAEEEAKARDTLKRAEGWMTGQKIPYSVEVERSRDVASALNAAAEFKPANHVLISLLDDSEAPDCNAKLVKSVLGKLSSAVLFVRGPVNS